MQKTIYVYESWRAATPTLLGRLFVESAKGRETFAFSYDAAWLAAPHAAFPLDPDLFLFGGRQYPVDKALFSIFSDSCPDRWGRLLMKRKEAIKAREESRKPRALLESDFLLGVYDKARMGALRFSLEEGGLFLADDEALATPPWIALRELEAAARAFEQKPSAIPSL